jgi:hypothetical protein
MKNGNIMFHSSGTSQPAEGGLQNTIYQQRNVDGMVFRRRNRSHEHIKGGVQRCYDLCILLYSLDVGVSAWFEKKPESSSAGQA